MPILPTVTINGSLYYDDERRGHDRLVSNPSTRIPRAKAEHLDHLVITRTAPHQPVEEQPLTQPRKRISFIAGQYRVIDNPQEESTMEEQNTPKKNYEDQPEGTYKVFINLEKKPGDKQPAYVKGLISMPAHPNVHRHFRLWAHKLPSGEICYNGPVTMPGQAQEENFFAPNPLDIEQVIAAREGGKDFKVKPHTITIFAAKPKEKEQAAEDEPAAAGGKPKGEPTNQYGYYNPGGGEPLVALSGWKKEDINGNLKMSGYTRKWEPRQEQAQEKAAEHTRPAHEKPRKKARAQDHDHEHDQGQAQ